MAFPEFDPTKRKILFFSRGRGQGHAALDIEAAQALHRRRGDLEIRFVSYSSGSRAFQEAGIELIDLGLPEDGATAEMTALAGKLIGWLRPELVVSHEEFAVAPVAKIFDCPVVFLLEWFLEADTYHMHALKFADRVLFMEKAGLFSEPPFLSERVEYLGRPLRTLSYGPEDRARARRELDLAETAKVLAIIPGAYATESRAPIADLLAPALDALGDNWRAVWVAGPDAEDLSRRLAYLPGLRVVDRVRPIERLMAAADVAVTKANRASALELHALGKPVVAITQEANPADDTILRATAGITVVRRDATEPEDLRRLIVEGAEASLPPSLGEGSFCDRLSERILAHLPALG